VCWDGRSTSYPINRHMPTHTFITGRHGYIKDKTFTSLRDTTILISVLSSVPAPFILLYNFSAKYIGRLCTHLAILICCDNDHGCKPYLTDSLHAITKITRHLVLDGRVNVPFGNLVCLWYELVPRDGHIWCYLDVYVKGVLQLDVTSCHQNLVEHWFISTPSILSSLWRTEINTLHSTHLPHTHTTLVLHNAIDTTRYHDTKVVVLISKFDIIL